MATFGPGRADFLNSVHTRGLAGNSVSMAPPHGRQPQGHAGAVGTCGVAAVGAAAGKQQDTQAQQHVRVLVESNLPGLASSMMLRSAPDQSLRALLGERAWCSGTWAPRRSAARTLGRSAWC